MLASARVTAAEQLDERPDAASLRDREPVRVVVRKGEEGSGGLLLGRVPTRAVEQTDEVWNGARLMREAITSQSRGHQWHDGPRLYPAGNQLGTWAVGRGLLMRRQSVGHLGNVGRGLLMTIR